MKIGAQLFTVRDFAKTPPEMEAMLRKIKSIGFDVVQVSGFPYEAKHLAELVKELSLDVCLTHTPLDRLQNDIDNVIAEHKLFGCDTVGLGSKPEALYPNTIEGYKNFIKDYNSIAEKLFQAGMKYSYHNHSFEFMKFGDKTGMDILIDELDPKSTLFTLDTYWVQAGGANPVNYIKKLKNRMKVCHFKDMTIVDKKQAFAEIGQGNMDFPAIIAACKEVGIPYAVIEEDTCPRDPFDCLKVSLDYLKKNV